MSNALHTGINIIYTEKHLYTLYSGHSVKIFKQPNNNRKLIESLFQYQCKGEQLREMMAMRLV